MKKIIFIWLLFIMSIPPMASASSINIDIDIKDSFILGESIWFDYAISSDTSLQITYMSYIACPNAPRARIEQKNIFLNVGEQSKETHFDFTIDNSIEPQTCEANIQILSPIQKKVSKNFSVFTNPGFSFNINFCKDQTCKEESKIFLKNENIYLDYLSEVENPSITATLTYPDKTSKQLTLPTSIKANQIGTYSLKVTASKQGYKTITETTQFAVIEHEVEVQYVSQCNANNECEPDLGEDYKTCPQDCVKEKKSGVIYLYAGAILVLLILVILIIVHFKNRIPPSGYYRNQPPMNYRNEPMNHYQPPRTFVFLIIMGLILPIGFSQQFISNIQQIISQEDTTIYNVKEDYEEEPIKYSGYIIEFKEEPILKVKKDIETKIEKQKEEIEELEQEIESVKWYNVVGQVQNIGRKNTISTKETESKRLEENLPNELRQQENKIENLHERLRGDISSSFASQITGYATAQQSKSKVMNEYKKVFSGATLDISDSEVDKIKRLDYVKSVYPNYEVYATLMDSISLMNADDVWDLGYTGKNVTIAIIDTGVDYTHPDLGGCLGSGCKVIGGYDFVNQDEDPMDDYGHGTHCAGIAAGNGILKGVAPDAKIVAYKVLNSYGSGSFSTIIAAIERAVDPNQDSDYSGHLDIISMSLGGNCGGNYDNSCGPDDPLSRSVNNAVSNGVVAVISAGNSGPFFSTIGTPGTAEEAITVGANKKDGGIIAFSSRGLVSWDKNILFKPDILAPGVSICSAEWDDTGESGLYNHCEDNIHISMSGTSMAAPHIAGAAALILQKYPDWSPSEVKDILLEGSIDDGLSYNEQGYGRVDILSSINKEYPDQFIRLNMIKNFVEVEGNGNQIIERGETIRAPFEIINGRNPLSEVNARLSSLSPYIEIITGEADYGSFTAYEKKSREFIFKVSEDVNGILPLDFEIISSEFSKKINFQFYSLRQGYSYRL